MSRGAFVGHCAALAGLLEVSAEKPGNVTPTHDFPGTTYHHFLASSIALESPMRRLAQDRGYRVGQGMLDCVKASHAVQSGGNVHLGVIILFAPMAKAAGSVRGDLTAPALRKAIGRVLARTTGADALDAFDAINTGHVSGLNPVRRLDARDKRTRARLKAEGTTFLEWMSVGKGTNSVCHEMVTDYGITFGLGLPTLLKARRTGVQNAIVHTFLTVLADRPDTHIAGKWGMAVARKVSARAGAVLGKGSVLARSGIQEAKKLTKYLRDRRINPGTTADLTASALFAALLTGMSP